MSQRPDFVMVGGQSDGKFFVMASKTLTEVELRVESERPYFLYGDRHHRMQPRDRHFITAEMRDYVTVVGDSYAEAFRTLFEEWSPEPDPQPAIASRPRLPPTPPRAITAICDGT